MSPIPEHYRSDGLTPDDLFNQYNDVWVLAQLIKLNKIRTIRTLKPSVLAIAVHREENNSLHLHIDPNLRFSAPTRLLGQVGKHLRLQIQNHLPLYPWCDLSFEYQEDNNLLVKFENSKLVIRHSESRIFGPSEPFDLLLGGLMVLPNQQLFQKAAQQGFVIGSYTDWRETVIAVPGRTLIKLEVSPGFGIQSPEPDTLYPVSLDPVTHQQNWTDVNDLLNNPMFSEEYQPLGLRTNTTAPINVHLKQRSLEMLP